jgi:EmrB/QacA subfamily drug resistance transporter
MWNKTKSSIFTATACTASLLVLSKIVIGVILPTIQKDLHLPGIDIHWVVNSYFLVLAVLVLGAGKLADIIGYRKFYLTGTVIFALSSALCGIADSFLELFIFRCLMGIGATLMMTVGKPILLSVFDLHERGKVNGISSSIEGCIGTITPLIGGIIIHFVSWHYIFLFNIPFCVLAFLLVWKDYPKKEESSSQKFDYFNFTFFAISLASLITGAMLSVDLSLKSPLILSCFIISIITFLIWKKIEKKSANPLIDASVIKQPIFSFCFFTLIAFSGITTISIIVPIYFQFHLDVTPAISGLMVIPAGIPVLLFGGLVGKWLDKKGPLQPMLFGTIILALCIAWMGYCVGRYGYDYFIIGHILYGLGMVLTISPCLITALNIIPQEKRASAYGILLGGLQIGALLGFTIIAIMLSTIQHKHVEKHLSEKFPHIKTEHYKHLTAITSGSEKAHSLIKHLPKEKIQQIKDIVLEGFNKSFAYTLFSFSVLCLIIALLLTPFLKNYKPLE